MKVVLSEIDLEGRWDFPNIKIIKITYKKIDLYNKNPEVFAVIGSRAIAKKINKMIFPNLKFYQLTSAGYDGVPVEDLNRKGIIVSKAGDIYSVPIAESVVFGMLTIAKKLHKNPNNRHFKIQRRYTEICELMHKKVMILGTGSIGQAIAKRLNAFDMIVYGFARQSREISFFNKIIQDKEELLTSLKDFDYVISTLPENNQTKNFIEKNFLGKMKETAVFLNVGRKTVYHEEALYSSLKHRDIGGAVLDIFEKVPNPITNRFRRLKNVVVFPGVVAISQEVSERLKNLCKENITRVIEGSTPYYVIKEKE